VLAHGFTPDGLDVVVVGQKNGNLYTLTAQAGTVVWSVFTGPDVVEGGLVVSYTAGSISFSNMLSGPEEATSPGALPVLTED
jgi:outer membrane protein assembly factor BamB